MRHDPQSESRAERVSAQAAERLLARASELDAAGGPSTELESLRAAAAEAGISSAAFDAALIEFRAESLAKGESAGAGSHRLRPRVGRWGLLLAAVMVTMASLLFFRARAFPEPPGMTTFEMRIQCLAPNAVTALVQPILTLEANTLQVSQGPAPRVLRIRATSAQIEQVRSALEQGERSCVVP